MSASRHSNTVRIGAGTWRSRLLRFRAAQGLRPTPDRVRETLFNWLGQELHGLRCLDLFAGSGALGFEAASRGAASVLMLEKNPQVFRDLQQNATLLQASQISLLNADAWAWLAAHRQQFDLIFLDPPFNQDWLPKLLAAVPAHLAPGGRVYVEAEKPLIEVAGFAVVKQSKAGQVFYHLLEYKHGE